MNIPPYAALVAITGPAAMAAAVEPSAVCVPPVRDNDAVPHASPDRAAMLATEEPTAALALAETRAWVDRAVIGLNLCPFAKAAQVKGQVRFVVSEARDAEALLAVLVDELKRLAETPPDRVETTLLIHPHVLTDFVDYNDFLDLADAVVAELDLEGVIQVASFHPQYCFAGSEADDLANATNRSPYPTLHLLREASIGRAVAAFPEAEAIFEANIATLHRLGAEGWAALRARCREDAALVTRRPTE